jgi:hypothetical protein
VDKAGSERKLAKELNISKSTVYFLKFEKRNISEEYLEKIKNYLKLNKTDLNIITEFSSTYWQKKGGETAVKKKIENGTFEKNIELLHKASSEKMKQWHKEMRENNPEKYYNWQYDRFRKIGRGYLYTLKDGTKVRNPLEKKIGDFLIDEFKEVRYEKYINIRKKAYFPDFTYKNIIIEVTEWKHPSKEKIRKLNEKVKNYSIEDYNVIFFIPEQYRKFYKDLENPIISTLTDLKDQIKAFIAQTRITKKGISEQ